MWLLQSPSLPTTKSLTKKIIGIYCFYQREIFKANLSIVCQLKTLNKYKLN